VPFGDELHVMLQPQRITLSRIGRGGKCLARQSMAVEQDTCGSTLPLWQAALATLHPWLQQRSWQGCRPTVVLSGHFAQYALILWNAGLATPDERQAYARHCFLQAYGEAARDWDLRIGTTGYGRTAIASGVAPELLQALQAAFAEAGMPLARIHPYLTVAVDDLRRRRLPASFCLAVPEAGRLLLALIDNGDWRSLRSFAAEPDMAAQLQALIERESIVAGLDTAHWPLWLYGPEAGRYAVTLAARQVECVLASGAGTPSTPIEPAFSAA
jgi:hypothetical protein